MKIACFLRGVLLPFCGLSGCTVITHFLIKDTIFGGGDIERKMRFGFLYCFCGRDVHENPSSVSRVFHADGRTDRHDEANSRFSQFLNVPYKMIIKMQGNKLMFLSEWREFPSAPCLAGRTT